MKKFIAMFVLAAMLLSFAGCGVYTAKNAHDLVKGNLDSFYMGIHDPEYLARVESTEEECEAIHIDLVESEAEYFAVYAEIEYLTDDIKAELAGIFEELYSNSKYTVGETRRVDENTFTVNVELYPFDIIERVEANYFDYLDDFITKYEYADVESMTDEEYMEYDYDWAVAITNALKAQLPNLGYKDAVTIIMEVVYNEAGGYWEISDDSWDEFLYAIIYYGE